MYNIIINVFQDMLNKHIKKYIYVTNEFKKIGVFELKCMYSIKDYFYNFLLFNRDSKITIHVVTRDREGPIETR
ncbi:hypothetical protein V1478_017613 [Vespula squamosa]|uniref:Uncharacterized protein n=1 Tax=Vespula squamosa TaxID=30214 RepID=A0ABD1ZWD8_VESSQ